MKISISFKLTLWYSLVFFATLVLYAVLLYYFISRQYYKQQNSLLKETAEEILQFVGEEGDSLNISNLKKGLADRNLNQYGIFFEIYDKTGKVQYRTVNFPDFKKKVEYFISGEEQKLLKDEYGIVFQIFISPIKNLSADEKDSPYYLVVGQSTLYVTNVLEKIREMLLYFGFGLLVVAGIGGWYLARRVLKPVSDITNTARDLTAYHLDKRLPEKGTDDELGLLIHTFNEMIDRIQNGVEKIQQFSSDASHELRTPLTIMRGEIEVALRKQRSGEAYQGVLKSLLEEVQRMEKIVEDLLFITRADSGHIPLENKEVDLVALTRDILKKMKPLAEEKNIKTSFRSEPEEIFYPMDTGKFGQLIGNILDNAIKYTKRGGEVDLEIKRIDSGIVIEVKDNGIGIPEKEISKVFDRFYRVDKSRSGADKSNGLGLSICKWIVEAYQGDIRIKSKEGVGTSVTVTLPV